VKNSVPNSRFALKAEAAQRWLSLPDPAKESYVAIRQKTCGRPLA